MTSENNIFGSINLYDTSSTTPSLKIDSSSSVPGIEFIPTGSSSNDTIRIVSDINQGMRTLYVCKGSSILFSIQDTPSNGSNLYIQPTGTSLVSPASILMSDLTGNIGTINTLPVSRGGTGISSLPSAGSLLGSNGTGYIPITAGMGINISGGVISATGSPEFTNISFDTPTPIPGVAKSITPSGDAGLYPVEYIATSSGTHIVANINITSFSVLTIRITSVRKSGTSGGGSNQLFNVVKDESSSKRIKQFGNNASTGENPSVTLTLVSNILNISTYLQSGDIWKSIIEFVSIV